MSGIQLSEMSSAPLAKLFDQKVTQQDVIDMVISEKIAGLKGNLKEITDAKEKAYKQLKEYESSLGEIAMSEFKKKYKSVVDAYLKANKSANLAYTNKIYFNPIEAILEVNDGSNGNSFYLSDRKLTTTSKEVVKHIKVYQKMQQAYDQLTKEANDLDKKISEMKGKQPEVRAAITRNLLEKSEDGKKMLSSLSTAFNKLLK